MSQHWKYRAEISKTRSYILSAIRNLAVGFTKAETELWKEPPEPLLDEIAELVMKDNPYWEGSPTALVALIKCGHSTARYHKKTERSCRTVVYRTWDSLSK